MNSTLRTRALIKLAHELRTNAQGDDAYHVDMNLDDREQTFIEFKLRSRTRSAGAVHLADATGTTVIVTAQDIAGPKLTSEPMPLDARAVRDWLQARGWIIAAYTDIIERFPVTRQDEVNCTCFTVTGFEGIEQVVVIAEVDAEGRQCSGGDTRAEAFAHKLAKDAGIVDSILARMSGQEWGSDLGADIQDILVWAGYEIKDSDGEEN